MCAEIRRGRSCPIVIVAVGHHHGRPRTTWRDRGCPLMPNARNATSRKQPLTLLPLKERRYTRPQDLTSNYAAVCFSSCRDSGDRTARR